MFTPVEGFDGVLHLSPTVHPDERGTFHEWFKASAFEEATGHPFDLQQANMSVSKAGVLRGLHYAEVPPGQAKFVTCPAGAIFDVVVDVREGSDSFGRWTSFELTQDNHHGVYIPAGYAHGFVAVRDSCVVYLTTSEYEPAAEHSLNPFDEQINVAWPNMDYILSQKDQQAPSVAQLGEEGLLPHMEECQAQLTDLRDSWAVANEEAGL
ncbi:dTDP-4-dehydrorhamnose 3,5-epimerase [Corynebacterium uberis]|uniref:dTDP-4-dehydrorhamnose 3,5-epimerase n=1 Tax=Corynebacterium TaxID=1716 RepID=UPI001D0A5BEF|nr:MULTISPECIES: dTDP-4-dehydrorhamnose 3,5-epimerase [Corynebacterium]MCZ9309491.1 dTDP-4-dehydrorhamnose 3,5-epimerase [Corynebacterium sp. c6VSa_13]UDL73041.1 dTDP-4-dehydrorhamnose 3,5-epimerase [Corynebacterium uberis]UDL76082.1 dTDP-4-dehydrorhamnose 3,5-epimerase [Corynebacterium uberis]UDL78294.1 dTDP-4-dehydrorhamnose 3,5-epimerase [Corynebacterium uberis]UDL80577.1 dTDP-4-dehydrorhamnose 3,5-epimerase [Corynebacterium uberis]